MIFEYFVTHVAVVLLCIGAVSECILRTWWEFCLCLPNEAGTLIH